MSWGHGLYATLLKAVLDANIRADNVLLRAKTNERA